MKIVYISGVKHDNFIYIWCAVTQFYLTLCDHHRLQPTRLFCPWDFPGKNWKGLLFPPPEYLPDQGIDPVSLACTNIQSAIITTVKLMNVAAPHHSYHFCVCFCVIRIPQIYSLSKCSVFSTVLITVVTILYDRSLDFFILNNCICTL